MRDYEYYVRDSAGRPKYFVQHHETHSHKGMCPHEHWIDLSDPKVESTMKHGGFDKYRDLDVRPAKWS